MPELLPVIHSIAGDMFIFHEDSVPAHHAHDTVKLLRCETPNSSVLTWASQQSWHNSGWLLHLGHDAEACIPSISLCCRWLAAAAYL